MSSNNTNTQNFGDITNNIKNIPINWIKYGEVFCNDKLDQPIFVCSICLRNAESIDVAYTTSDGSVFWRHIQQHHITEECETIDKISAEIQNFKTNSDESEVVSYGEIDLRKAEPANVNCDEMDRNQIKVFKDSRNLSKDDAIKEAKEIPNNPSIQKESQEVHKNNSPAGATDVAIETDKESNKFEDIGNQVHSFSNCDYSHHNDKNQTYTVTNDGDDVNKSNDCEKLIRMNGERSVIDYLKHNDVIEISDEEEFSEDNVDTRSNSPTLLDENTVTWDDADNFGNHTNLKSNYIEESIPCQTNSAQTEPTPDPLQINSIQRIPTPPISYSNSHQGISTPDIFQTNSILGITTPDEFHTNSIQRIPTPFISHSNSNQGIPTPDIFQANSIPDIPTPADFQSNPIQSIPTSLISDTNSYQGIPIPVISQRNPNQGIPTADVFQANSIPGIPTPDTSPCEALANQQNNTDLNYFQSNKFKKRKHSKNRSYAFRAFQCIICGRRTITKETMKTHLSRYHEFSPQELETHQNLDDFYHQHSQADVIGATKKLLKCHMCHKKFQSTESMERHHQLYHRPNLHTKQCEICHIRIDNKRLECHMKSHFSKQINCQYCGSLLKDKYHLSCHISAYHPDTNSSSVPVYQQQFGMDLSSYGMPNNNYPMPPRLTYENEQQNSYQDYPQYWTHYPNYNNVAIPQNPQY